MATKQTSTNGESAVTMTNLRTVLMQHRDRLFDAGDQDAGRLVCSWIMQADELLTRWIKTGEAVDGPDDDD